MHLKWQIPETRWPPRNFGPGLGRSCQGMAGQLIFVRDVITGAFLIQKMRLISFDNFFVLSK